MATQKQIDANRLNAQKSTGPRTDEGKAAVSRNALAHGLFSEDVVLSEEDRPAYEAFQAALQQDLQPVGALEESSVQQIAWLQWRINRIARIETGLFDDEIVGHREREKKLPAWRGPKDQPPRPNYSRILGIAYRRLDETLGRLARYESHFRRSMSRCLQDLESLQKSRMDREKDKVEKTKPIPPQPAEKQRPPIPFPAPADGDGIAWLPAREPDPEDAGHPFPALPGHTRPDSRK